MELTLTHKTYNTVYADEEEFHSSDKFIRVRLKTVVHLPHQGTVRSLTVGKAAIKEKSRGYTPRKTKPSLAEQYMPLAKAVTSRMRGGNDDYEELLGVAVVGMMTATRKVDDVDHHVGPYLKTAMENAIRMHWREQHKAAPEFCYAGDFDKLLTYSRGARSERIEHIEQVVQLLRPRLRTLITELYFSKQPKLAKELAYEWNISDRRFRQLKQEAIELLRDILEKK